MSDLTPDQVFTVAVIILLIVVCVVIAWWTDRTQADRDIEEQQSKNNLMSELSRHENGDES